jgi:hypothetical protein
MLGQDPNLAKATSSISQNQSEQETLNEESDSENDSNSDIIVKSPIISDKVEKSITAKSASRSISKTNILKMAPVIKTKASITGSKVMLMPLVINAPKAASKTPSEVSVQPSDSVSQVGKTKSILAKAARDMSNLFRKLSPGKRAKTPEKETEAKMSPKIDKPKTKQEIKDMTPQRQRDRILSDESPDKFLTPESSPEKGFETPKVSTQAQGAIPKTGARFMLKPSKFNIPLDQPVQSPKQTTQVKKEITIGKSEKRKAESPSKDDLEKEKPEPKVVVRPKAILPIQESEGRPKRNIARPDYKALHTKGIRRDKSPEY